MLKDTRERHGLRELILSHNTRITCDGWRRLAMSLASGSSLRTLHVDFNVIGDACAASLVTALPGATCLETLDMECTGITDFSGQLLLRLLQHFKLKTERNKYREKTRISWRQQKCYLKVN
ncbi:leucine-rich repeat-containing protein 73-like [Dreissena polymorpha]|uniref:leucine-rich repeat-containing protein 73-like n=1 Tax=Dreissena polymorpha TaxID=45954 RepID=UPI00226488C4|nr:leucine-rich repeat-containing protein 73-like [Dreissena polymorpha]